MVEQPEHRIENADPPEFHLAALNRQIREMMDFVLRPHGLKLVEWRLMQCLDQDARLTINDLSELAVIERTVTSRLVDKLVDRQWVRKRTMDHDRRYAQVELTAKGRAQVQGCNKDVAAARSQLFEGLDQSDLVALLNTLERMQANVAGIYRGGGQRSRMQSRS